MPRKRVTEYVPRKPGRRTKYTPENIANIVKLLEGGSTDKDMLAAVGIAASLYYDWLRNYPDFAEKVDKAKSVAKQRAVDAVQSALVEREQTSQTVKEVSETRFNRQGEQYIHTRTTKLVTKTKLPPDGHLALELLERRDPEHYGRSLNIRVTNEDAELLKSFGLTAYQAWQYLINNLRNVTPEQAAQLRQAQEIQLNESRTAMLTSGEEQLGTFILNETVEKDGIDDGIK